MFVFQMPAGLNRLQIMLFFRKILLHVLLVFNLEKMESTRFDEMNGKTTTRAILFV